MPLLRPLLFVVLLALPLPLAFADDAVAGVSVGAASSAPSDDPFVRYLLGLGPIGALVYGAFLLGKGVKVSVVVHLSEDDRRLADRATTAVENLRPQAIPLPFPRANGG